MATFLQTLRGRIDLHLAERALAGGLIGHANEQGAGLDRKRQVRVREGFARVADGLRSRQERRGAGESQAGGLELVHLLRDALGERIELAHIRGQGLIAHRDQAAELAAGHSERRLRASLGEDGIPRRILGVLQRIGLGADDQRRAGRQDVHLTVRLRDDLHIDDGSQLIDQLIALIQLGIGAGALDLCLLDFAVERGDLGHQGIGLAHQLVGLKVDVLAQGGEIAGERVELTREAGRTIEEDAALREVIRTGLELLQVTEKGIEQRIERARARGQGRLELLHAVQCRGGGVALERIGRNAVVDQRALLSFDLRDGNA